MKGKNKNKRIYRSKKILSTKIIVYYVLKVKVQFWQSSLKKGSSSPPRPTNNNSTKNTTELKIYILLYIEAMMDTINQISFLKTVSIYIYIYI